MTDTTKFEATLRIPTDTYAFLEIKVNDTPEGILEAWERFKSLTKSGSGLTDAEFDQFIENQVSGKSNTLAQYEKMSPEQQKYVQINKRAIKRLNYKLTKEEK